MKIANHSEGRLFFFSKAALQKSDLKACAVAIASRFKTHIVRASAVAFIASCLLVGSAFSQGITQQPANQIVAVGSSATFMVSVSIVNPQYQWRKNGGNISGATTARLDLPNVQLADSGSRYDVVVTGIGGPATSAQATLTVLEPVLITAQPESRSVVAGAGVSFGVSAIGTSPTYQWRKNGVNRGGATSATLSINNVQVADGGNYDVVVQNAVSSAISSSASLAVLVAPTIQSQPSSAAVMPDTSSTSFRVMAAGSATLTYQWMKDGAAVAGATAATLIIYSPSLADAGSYTVKVSNSAGSVTSSAATLLIGPAITAQPADVSVPKNGNANFAVSAAGSAPLTYQWYFNSTALGGQTSPTLNINNVQPANGGKYYVRVRNAAGFVDSRNATLSVLSPPTVTAPASYVAAEGEDVTFNVSAGGATPLSFQWKFQSTGGGPSTEVPGVNGSSLILNNVTPANAGYYTVTVQNSLGSVTSTPAQLTVTPQPKITDQPQSQNLPPFTNATFRVTAFGRNPLSYQWYRDGSAIQSVTNSSLTLTNVALTDSGGIFTVTVSNQWGTVTSQPAHLTINSSLVGLGTMLWSVNIPSSIAFQQPPLIGPDGTLYVGGTSNLYAVSSSGQIKWTIPNTVPLAIAANGTSYNLRTGTNGTLTAIDQNGLQQWSFGTFRTIWTGSGVASNLTQIALRSNGDLLCFAVVGSSSSGPNGSVLRQLKDSGQFVKDLNNVNLGLTGGFGVVATDDTLTCPIAQVLDNGATHFALLGALNPDGSLYWFLPRGSKSLTSRFWCVTPQNELLIPFSPTSGGLTYLRDSGLICYSQSGIKLWETSFAIGAQASPVIAPDGAIVLGTREYGDGLLTALNSDGTRRWQRKPADVDTSDPIFTPAIAADGTIHFTARFSLYAYDLFGAQKWQYETRERINSSPIVGADGTVYFSTISKLYAIKGSAPLAATSWPVEGGNPRHTFRATEPPAFTAASQSVSETFGGNAVFTTTATGTPPLIFQWRFQGTNLLGATNASLILNQVTMSDAGVYEVEVINPDTGLLVRTNAQLTVTPANPVVTWQPLTSIPFGTALGQSQLGAIADVPGTFDYQPPEGFILSGGTNLVVAIFTPEDSANYNTVTITNVLVVERGTPTITWPQIDPMPYGTGLGSGQLSATANVAGTFTYVPPAGIILPAGTNELAVTFMPFDTTDYTSVSASNSVVVLPQPVAPSLGLTPSGTFLIISWSAASGTFGLEMSEVLGNDSSWMPVTNGVARFGDTFIFAVFPTHAQTFFRLRQK